MRSSALASFETVVTTGRSDLVRLARGSQAGKKTWYYVRVEKFRFPIYQQKMRRGETINVYDFGEVLYAGWGENPPSEITRKIQEEFS